MNTRSQSMGQPRIACAAAVLSLALAALTAPDAFAIEGGYKPAQGLFRHLATFDVMAGNGSEVAEIVDVTVNRNQLVYTDSPQRAIGFVDISDPRNPKGQGTVAVGGEPTSLVVLDPLILVGVNTSESYTRPSGKLVVVHRNTRQIVAEHDLGGQPDSLALAPDRKRVAIVIENERDEDLNDGLLPQAPSGGLLIVDLRSAPQRWKITRADLAPVAAAAANGTDLEPEYVDINQRNLAVVSFQENNHLAVVDLVTGKTVNQFPAGSADLSNVDIARDSLISPDSDITRRREPDAVAWIDADSFATANEGDYTDADDVTGGSRGFTVFNINGTVEYESAESFEHWIMRAGHYNERRSNSKGVEPEAVEFGVFGDRRLLFVGSERSNAVGVYDVTTGAPAPLQLLPTGIGPEGMRAIPGRGLFVASTETSNPTIGIPTMINIYGLVDGPARYPMIESVNDAAGLPIPWVALSGLAGDPQDPDTLYAVSDSYLSRGFIYRIDVGSRPAKIVQRLEVTGASVALDLEGIAVGPDGALWLASEGNGTTRPNRVLKVDPSNGQVLLEIGLPGGLETGTERRNNGFEGISVEGAPDAEVVYVAIQRAWLNGTGDTDGVNTKLGRYEVASGSWGFVHYPLEPVAGGEWIGLSELTRLPDGKFAVIERDKGWGPSTGPNAELKALYQVDLAGAPFRPFDHPGGLVTVAKTLLRDVLPDLAANSVWTPEKLEGFAIGADGRAYVVTDNDGVQGGGTDIYPGETVFLDLGPWTDL